MTRIVQSGRRICGTTTSPTIFPPPSPPLSRASSSLYSRTTISTRKLLLSNRSKYALHIVSATDFHQKRLSADETGQKTNAGSRPHLKVTGALIIRIAERDDELEAVSWLRARSFYAYPEERKFAGEVRKKYGINTHLTK